MAAASGLWRHTGTQAGPASAAGSVPARIGPAADKQAASWAAQRIAQRIASWVAPRMAAPRIASWVAPRIASWVAARTALPHTAPAAPAEEPRRTAPAVGPAVGRTAPAGH